MMAETGSDTVDRRVTRGGGLARRGFRAAQVIGAAALAGGALTGCHWDSFLDPSVVGRWERTPAVVPVLDRVAAIEAVDDSELDFTEVTPEDLEVETQQYRISSGDVLDMIIWDIVTPGAPEQVLRTVDQNGYVQVLQLGRVFVGGLTEDEVRVRLETRMRRLVGNPIVSVVVQSRLGQQYSITGAIPASGAYALPSNDYRLLEAVIAAGGVEPAFAEFIFVIRQVPLTDATSPNRPEFEDDAAPDARPGAGTTADGAGGGGEDDDGGDGGDGEDVLDLIDQIIGDTDGGQGVMPGVMRGRAQGGAAGSFQPVERAVEGSGEPGDVPAPLIDLDDSDRGATPPVDLIPGGGGSPAPGADGAGGGGSPRWVYVDDRWVRVAGGAGAGNGSQPPIGRTGDAGGPSAGVPLQDGGSSGFASEPAVAQRIIRVPTGPLVAGDARFNIVIRPGDVIRVPPPEQGNIYLAGQISRPGVFALPPVGRLTLLRAVDAAGGLGPLAIPERVDLTRMVGPNRQAMIMLNLRAIAEGTQPDLYLKPNDRIVVGTNFWATPLAVIRGGFRASYGFGFLLDRNFGNDVFGAPPSRVGNQ